MSRLLAPALVLLALVAAPASAAGRAYCVVKGTTVTVAGQGVTTPSVTVPCP